MVDIKNNIFENEIFYKGNLILKYKIEYPSIYNRCNKNEFNNYNYSKALKLKNYAETVLLKQAQETFEYNNANGYPSMVFELIYEDNRTHNNNNLISLYADEYIFSGGAHGLTTRTSQNWNMQCYKQITLNDIFPNNPYYIIDILKSINNQIEEQINNASNQYFDNYCKLVLETFKLDQFYITSNNEFAVYFQSYDIAPYSSGIPVFYMKIYNKKFY